jgi:hypothetical protein
MVDQGKTHKGPILLVIIGLVLIGAAAGYLIWNDIQNDQTNSAAQVDNQVRVPYSNVHRISVSEALSAFKTGEAVFVDVRGAQYYDQGHIVNALSIPEEELPQRLAELQKSQWIITYCT